MAYKKEQEQNAILRIFAGCAFKITKQHLEKSIPI